MDCRRHPSSNCYTVWKTQNCTDSQTHLSQVQLPLHTKPVKCNPPGIGPVSRFVNKPRGIPTISYSLQKHVQPLELPLSTMEGWAFLHTHQLNALQILVEFCEIPLIVFHSDDQQAIVVSYERLLLDVPHLFEGVQQVLLPATNNSSQYSFSCSAYQINGLVKLPSR
jgi:hypothetical protein